MKQAGQSATFGRRKEPHTVIIARGDEIKHFTIKPWVGALLGSTFAAIAIGYLLATSYLVLRDDLIGASVARQARMQQAYEDRISALRAQVDRITSRQLLDQQLVESKVSELLERQTQLSQRHGKLGPLLDRAGGMQAMPEAAPVPPEKPEIKAELGGANPLLASTGHSVTEALSFWGARQEPSHRDSAADRADKLFVGLNQSLRSIESEQMERVSRLAENAYERADTIAGALEAAGLSVDRDEDRPALGGPLVPLDPTTAFDAKVRELDEALTTLETVKAAALRLPIANPAPGRSVTSTFGPRRDPLLGTMALHSGMDFRSSVGSSVHATGAGKVIHAGWNGGYGKMVEIDHGDGLVTRYAHMSAVTVRVGQNVNAGDEVGASGNSGRSTGPHLHYEVRRNGEALNPLPFIKAGRKIGRYLTSS
ncbi:M23 family metallopeptidase [Arvimicrobium flavum]|uniref:M23 family metallopeptidase n=1 Tax=Arvimicrobium flavum TaxID=3393320 RepID=UPI00237A7AB6|nr:M23 family metallopeptidase [Mesorhizobium shangrilense]